MRTLQTKPGYLLIELLAAITLVGIALAALVPSLSIQTDRAARAEQIDRLGDLDRRARLLAIREGPLFLSVDPTSSWVVRHDDQSETILRVEVNGESYLMDSGGEHPIGAVRFDRLGRSEDYKMLIRSVQNQPVLLAVNGVTGGISEVEVAP